MSRRRIRTQARVWLAGLALGAMGMTCTQKDGQAPQIIATSTDVASRVFAPTPAFAQAVPQSDAVTVADIAERAVASVVNISATKVAPRGRASRTPFFEDPFFREFFGHPGHGIPKEQRQQSLGSGVIVSNDGIVITNNHVVEYAEDVEVSLSDGRDFEAKVIGTDPKSDLAVLRLEGDVEGLSPLSFGDSSELRLGEVVIAIGNPFGVGQTVTMGIVSAKGRANVGIVDYEDFIQTDAAINPGNSGGALVNMRGELVGVNTAILSRSGGYQGIGFAIPSNLAEPVMKSLAETGKVVRGWLGVTIQDISEELATGLGLKAKDGVLISDVHPDGPASNAGFSRGDVVVAMDGEKVASTAKLRNRIAIAGPGAKVKFDIVRDGKPVALEAKLGELPEQFSGGTSHSPADGALSGITLHELTPEARKRLDVPGRVASGVVVDEVAPGSQAARAGLRSGDVIVELNQKPVRDVAEFRAAYQKRKGTVLLLVVRQGATVYVALSK